MFLLNDGISWKVTRSIRKLNRIVIVALAVFPRSQLPPKGVGYAEGNAWGAIGAELEPGTSGRRGARTRLQFLGEASFTQRTENANDLSLMFLRHLLSKNSICRTQALSFSSVDVHQPAEPACVNSPLA